MGYVLFLAFTILTIAYAICLNHLDEKIVLSALKDESKKLEELFETYRSKKYLFFWYILGPVLGYNRMILESEFHKWLRVMCQDRGNAKALLRESINWRVSTAVSEILFKSRANRGLTQGTYGKSGGRVRVFTYELTKVGQKKINK